MAHRWRFAATLLILVGLAGCHLTGAMPVDLDPGHGRVERTFTTNLGLVVRAALDALDDLQVNPKALSIRSNDRASDLGNPKWVGQTNSEYFPNDASYRDLFEYQRLNVETEDKSQRPPVVVREQIPFAPILVSYKGQLADGREVVVVVRSLPPEARETRIVARVGHSGDETWGRKLLDNVAGRLGGNQFAPNPPQSGSNSATPAATTATPATTSGTNPPADLPSLPPG